MRNKCLLILPYFGKFKNYFPLFLRSCESNPSVDWVIITDNEIDGCHRPCNVRFVSMTFSECVECFNSKFSFDVALDRPYKLCDFKPAYGYVFSDLIENYDYWGHCDCDLIFGNFEATIDSLMDRGYDKIFSGGHLCLYKNTADNLKRFMKPHEVYGPLFEKAFSSSSGFAFDEMCYRENVHTLFRQDNASIYENDLSFNVSTANNVFRRCAFDPTTDRWTDSTKTELLYLSDKDLFGLSVQNGALVRTDYIYLHLQGRQMKLDSQADEPCIHIRANKFVACSNPPSTLANFILSVLVDAATAPMGGYLHQLKRLLRRSGFVDALEINPYLSLKQVRK